MTEVFLNWSRELEHRTQNEVEALNKAITAKDSEIGELRKAKQRLVEERQRLVKELQQCRASRSWRLTAPLRVIYSIGRSLKS